MAHDIESVSAWLLRNTVLPADPEAILRGLADRLNACGIPIARISLGRSMLHPNLGMMDLTWDAGTDKVKTETASREMISANRHRQGPFRDLMQVATNLPETSREEVMARILASPHEALPRISANLTDATQRARYALFDRLAREGMTGYFAYSMPFSTEIYGLGDIAFVIGASASFACKGGGGFSADGERALIEIALPLMGCLRMISENFLTRALLQAYVGPNSADEVLSGQISLGDMREIDCVLLFSDLQGSTALSQDLAARAYLDLLNRYFGHVAGAVEAAGGEVLKFIGDGVLAVFPVADSNRQAVCHAALGAARKAIASAGSAQGDRSAAFGLALDIGKVYYGNVGTPTRLDFTVTGAAVARASRIEALTRELDRPILASKAFSNCCDDQFQPLPAQFLRGFEDPVQVVAYAV